MKFGICFNVWGDKFLKNFNNFCLASLLINLNNLNKTQLKNLEIFICTNDNSLISLNNLQNLTKIRKLVKVKIINKSKIINKKNLNIYLKLCHLENYMLNYISNKVDYVSLLDPDNIFSPYYFKNIITKANEKKFDLMLTPVPRVENEKINIYFKKFVNFKLNFFDMIFQCFHDSFYANDIQKLKNNRPTSFILKNNNDFYIKDFHQAPILYKMKVLRKLINKPFFPSKDEGVPEIFLKKKIYFQRDNKIGFACSLSRKEDMVNFGKYNEYKYNIWAFSHFSKIHLKAAEKIFLLSKKNERNVKIENKLNLLVNKKLKLFFQLEKKLMENKKNLKFKNDSIYISAIKNFYNNYILKKKNFLKEYNQHDF